jgi:hypothetical protein
MIRLAGIIGNDEHAISSTRTSILPRQGDKAVIIAVGILCVPLLRGCSLCDQSRKAATSARQVLCCLNRTITSFWVTFYFQLALFEVSLLRLVVEILSWACLEVKVTAQKAVAILIVRDLNLHEVDEFCVVVAEVGRGGARWQQW